jgi:hypothetical protein
MPVRRGQPLFSPVQVGQQLAKFRCIGFGGR